MNQIAVQFVLASALVLASVCFHGVGLFCLNTALRNRASDERRHHTLPLSPRGILFTLASVVAMFGLHGIEIWGFALVYFLTEAVPGIENSLYFSTISYSTVGYSDGHIANDWRLVGAFESILGVFLLGWSTAFFFRMLVRLETS